jgi:vacuolar-type H+-ATPase subunit F/Vma7
MLSQKIHILGQEDLVVLLGLLGLEGTIINSEEEFIKEFNKLIKDPSISMIVIFFPLNDETINLLIDFKLYNKIPFIFILPDVFKPHIDEEGDIVNKILEAIREIVLSEELI